MKLQYHLMYKDPRQSSMHSAQCCHGRSQLQTPTMNFGPYIYCLLTHIRLAHSSPLPLTTAVAYAVAPPLLLSLDHVVATFTHHCCCSVVTSRLPLSLPPLTTIALALWFLTLTSPRLPLPIAGAVATLTTLSPAPPSLPSPPPSSLPLPPYVLTSLHRSRPCPGLPFTALVTAVVPHHLPCPTALPLTALWHLSLSAMSSHAHAPLPIVFGLAAGSESKTCNRFHIG